MSRYFLRHDEVLVHGVELVAQYFEMDQEQLNREVRGRRDERQFYTVSLIDGILRNIAHDQQNYENLRDSFVRMMAFDALVGANDRHPQNWGVVKNTQNRSIPPRFSPLFDTARGLFWNHPDEKLRAVEKKGQRREFIIGYATGSTPLIGVEGKENPSHFDLIDNMVNSPKGFALAARSLLKAFVPAQLDSVLQRGAGRYFSRLRLQFIRDLLLFRYTELSKRCKL